MNKYSALIGAAMGFYNYPQVAFGGDVPGGADLAACNPYGLAAYDPALQALMAKNSVVVGSDCGPRAKDMPLPIGTGQTIDANSTLTINATPQCLFTPTALLIPSTIASSLIINDITIGTNSQFAAIGPIPAMGFIETATYRGLVWDTCLPNQPIQIQLQNITDGEVTFYGMFMGKAIPGGWPQIYAQYPR